MNLVPTIATKRKEATKNKTATSKHEEYHAEPWASHVQHHTPPPPPPPPPKKTQNQTTTNKQTNKPTSVHLHGNKVQAAAHGMPRDVMCHSCLTRMAGIRLYGQKQSVKCSTYQSPAPLPSVWPEAKCEVLYVPVTSPTAVCMARSKV